LKLFSILLIGLLITGCSYLPNEVAQPIGFTLTETSDYILLSPEHNEKGTGIMFVPGGLVDPHAYIKTFERFAIDNKFPVLILKVRSNLAIFNNKQATRVSKEFENTKYSL